MGDFAGDRYSSVFGVCNWYAWYRRQDRGFLSNAAGWTSAARARGIPTGSAPAAGATAVFAPGVQGAGGGGHVAHVERVLGGGWFIVSEMNFYFNGGGWGRVSYRYAHSGPGVSFVY
jgi:surface antigen